MLDAIYYLAFTKSAFNHLDSQLIKKGEDSFFLNGHFITNKKKSFISAGLKKGSKKEFMCDKKSYDKLNEHIGKIPVVLITPYDTDLIREGSETRRKFFDSIISQLDSKYLTCLIKYNHLLKQRNSILKTYLETRQINDDLLSVITQQMIPLTTYIFKARKTFLNTFITIFKTKYKVLTNQQEKVNVKSKIDLSVDTIQNEFDINISKDKQTGRTNFGPHRQDYTYFMNDMNVNKFGSQGQQKSFIIALKLAQFEIIENQKGIKPILMLDDMFDRIDQNRINQFIEMINSNQFGQIFITDTHHDRIESTFKNIKHSLIEF